MESALPSHTCPACQAPVAEAAAFCSRCGRPTQVSFRPDGIRPVFCKDCLSLAKQEKKQEIDARLEAKKRELASINEPPPRESRMNFSAAPAKPAIGLGQAIKSGPVDFQGKKIEPKPAARPTESPARAGTDGFGQAPRPLSGQPEKVIKENEEIAL